MTLYTPSTVCRPHNHDRCIDQALNEAKQLCQRRKLRLTPIREEVLRLIWSSHNPLGAYAILDRLETPEDQRRPAPPTVYRALDFLQEHGLIHRLASLNAFVGCCTPGEPHQGHFLICRECGVVVEIEGEKVDQSIEQSALRAGFSIDYANIEVTGLCPECRGAAA